MDWPKDSAFLSENESAMKNVFKYNPSPSLVVEILQSSSYEPRVSVVATDANWEEWAEAINYDDRGLILILATRVGCQATLSMGTQPISIDGFLNEARKSLATPFEIRRAQILSPLAEKSKIVEKPISRGVRTVPFSPDTFKFLSNRMRIHESITRTISRSDVATFNADQVIMHKPALVYSCRTSKAWDMDLALSQTHYPQGGLSLSVLYGCDLSTNREVLKRIRTIREEAAHPLLMPGIIAEIELGRQIPIVEADIISVETRVLELDAAIASHTESPLPVALQKRIDKRTAWLDLAYLRNSLVNWSAQLARMAQHTDELERQSRQEKHSQVAQRAQMELVTPPTYVPYSLRSAKPSTAIVGIYDSMREKSSSGTSKPEPRDDQCFQVERDHQRLENGEASIAESPEEAFTTNTELVLTNESRTEPDDSSIGQCEGALGGESSEDHPSSFAREEDEYAVKVVGDKIKRRLQFLQAEFEEMIRSCNMRLEGMAMATQWSHSETNVEIASATRQDSRIMKSISLVTMVFLPGTFFATVFSMTFFDWSGDSASGEKTRVSSYVWIYVVITVIFTVVTVAAWYFFVILRRRIKMMKSMSSAV